MSHDSQLPALSGFRAIARGSTYPAAIIDGQPRFADTAPQRALSSPIDAAPLGNQQLADAALVSEAVECAQACFLQWREQPAALRGELVRRIAQAVRDHQRELARVITLEVGKTPAEAQAEVQQWINSCDFAVAISCQTHGVAQAGALVNQRIQEQWHPLGVIGVITPFSAPISAWARHAMLALVCGNAVVWKPSEKSSLCALAVQTLLGSVLGSATQSPPGLNQLLIGDPEAGQALAADPRVACVTATGSLATCRQVAASVGARLGRSLSEPGGNNAMIVAPSALLDPALRAIVLAAVGACGQACSSLRRLIVHESVIAELLPRLQAAFASLQVGDPRVPGTVVGPLIDSSALSAMQHTLERAAAQGARLLVGGERITEQVPAGGCYVRPALLRVPYNLPVVMHESCAPLLYLMPYSELEDAIALNNAVVPGHSSAIFTERLQEAERFLSATGSQCAIADVNTGASEAVAGPDRWKPYMRRASNTLDFGHALPSAAGSHARY